MDSKEPFVNATLLTYAWVVGVSIWGGLVSYFEKKEKFAIWNLVGHLASSSFAGLLTFFACHEAGLSGPITGICCGIAAHMGTPALINLAMKLRVVKNFFDPSATEDKKEKQ